MTAAELFAPQLVRDGAPSCVLCHGKAMNGFDCTCAVQRMWLYRASQGALNASVCHIRDLTGDCIGGTNLGQMEKVSTSYGITGGRYYHPIDVDQVFAWIDTGRYGTHFDVSYEPFVGTPYDRFFGRFRDNHDVFLSGPGKSSSTIRVGDPGAKGFHDVPKSLLKQAAGLLAMNPSGSVTLNDEAGRGKCYSYLTPIDPATSSTRYHAEITGETPLYKPPNHALPQKIDPPKGKAYGYTVTRSMVNAEWWYRIVGPAKSGYLGLSFKPTSVTHITVI